MGVIFGEGQRKVLGTSVYAVDTITNWVRFPWKRIYVTTISCFDAGMRVRRSLFIDVILI